MIEQASEGIRLKTEFPLKKILEEVSSKGKNASMCETQNSMQVDMVVKLPAYFLLKDDHADLIEDDYDEGQLMEIEFQYLVKESS